MEFNINYPFKIVISKMAEEEKKSGTGLPPYTDALAGYCFEFDCYWGGILSEVVVPHGNRETMRFEGKMILRCVAKDDEIIMQEILGKKPRAVEGSIRWRVLSQTNYLPDQPAVGAETLELVRGHYDVSTRALFLHGYSGNEITTRHEYKVTLDPTGETFQGLSQSLQTDLELVGWNYPFTGTAVPPDLRALCLSSANPYYHTILSAWSSLIIK